MTDAKTKRLEELQWMATNDKDNPKFDQVEMANLTREVQEERGEPVTGDSGTIGDKDQNGKPDNQEKSASTTDEDRKGTERPPSDRGGLARGGVTTTKNINK